MGDEEYIAFRRHAKARCMREARQSQAQAPVVEEEGCKAVGTHTTVLILLCSLLLYSYYCTHTTVLVLLYSYCCTHTTVLMLLYSYYCAYTTVHILLYSCTGESITD
jgi:hypothetical protein